MSLLLIIFLSIAAESAPLPKLPAGEADGKLKCKPRPINPELKSYVPGTLVGAPPVGVGDKAAKLNAEWKVAGANDDLFCEPVENLGTLGDMDARKVQGEVLKRCAETSINGRKDTFCEADPSHPECIGSKQALINATTCREYHDPAKPELGCKVMGAGKYDAEVWLAFAETFVNAAVDCSALKTEAEDRVEKKQVFKTDGTAWEIDGDEVLASAGESLTVMLAPTTSTTGAATSPPNGQNYGQSTVSGSVKKEQLSNSGEWEEVSKTLDDGSSLLGLSEGELLRQRAEGKSFAEIIKSSPFFDGLNAGAQQKIGNSLEDSGAIVNRVKQEIAEENGTEVADNSAELPTAAPELSGPGVITASGASRKGLPNQLVSKASEAKSGAIPRSGKSAALASLPQIDLVKEATLAAAAIAAAEEESNRVRRMLEAERIARLGAAARKARASGRTLASVLADSTPVRQFTKLELFQLSLFARIQHAYEKIRPRVLPPPPVVPPTPTPPPLPEVFKKL